MSLTLLCMSSGIVVAQLTGMPRGNMLERQIFPLATSFGPFALDAASDEQRRLNTVLRHQSMRLVKLVDDLNGVI